MSKIGDYNLELQEQANELGFGTVLQALDAGYEDVGGQLVKSIDKQMAEAHEAYEKEKTEVLDELKTLRSAFEDLIHPHITATLDKTIEFIERGEE